MVAASLAPRNAFVLHVTAASFHDLEGSLPLSTSADVRSSAYFPAETPPQRGTLQQEANMGKVIQFIPKAERERIRLIREARARYESVFPSSDSVKEQRERNPIAHSVVNGTGVYDVDDLLS
jgi:hypothetical protein